MVLDLDMSALGEAVASVESLEDGLDTATRRDGQNSIYQAMGEAIDDEMETPVLQRARQLGTTHVDERAQQIRATSGHWAGNEYVAGLRTTNEVVLAHNFGSGQYASSGPYTISPGGEDQQLAFTVDGRQVFAEIVVHPGVRGKQFMQRAVRERADTIARSARDAGQDALEDALDT